MTKVEKRARNRSKMVIGVRLSGKDKDKKSDLAGTLVHTLDISPTGARLAGLREHIDAGTIVTLQRQHKRAKCKVAWCREVAPREIQIGVQFVEAEPGFWGVDLAQDTKSSDEKKLWTLLAPKEK
jgi:PilZ domain-containing protein